MSEVAGAPESSDDTLSTVDRVAPVRRGTRRRLVFAGTALAIVLGVVSGVLWIRRGTVLEKAVRKCPHDSNVVLGQGGRTLTIDFRSWSRKPPGAPSDWERCYLDALNVPDSVRWEFGPPFGYDGHHGYWWEGGRSIAGTAQWDDLSVSWTNSIPDGLTLSFTLR